MSRKKLLWQVSPYYLIIIVGALVTSAFYVSKQMREIYQEQVTNGLLATAELGRDQLTADLLSDNENQIDKLCKKLGEQSKSRITFVGMDGRVIGDSHFDPTKLENYKTRPEISEAFIGKVSIKARFSSTQQQNMMFVAIPLEINGQIKGVLRTGVPFTIIDRALSKLNQRIFWSGIIITLLATIVSLIIFKRLSRPLADLKEGAERFARGEFKTKIAVPDSEEIGALAESMNQMAEQLDERISTVVKQRNEQQALLTSMIEGVLAVDADERIININTAAAQLFQIEPNQAIKKSVYEVIRHAELHDFIAATLANFLPVEKEISIQSDPEKILQAHGSVMFDADGDRVGAVIVLNDVTRLKKLENIRRDFVANVSHELKTPITSIRGFVETLLDGAINDSEEAKRFLGIIVKQADRLNSIVDDLLILSRIERESERREIELRTLKLWDVLNSAVQACEPLANSKSIKLELSGDRTIVADVNYRQLEQAVTNLIDNAIKYSETKNQINITANQANGEINISVQDHGNGIDQRHLPRIFERFYRVDKSRSRDIGGTGLGLAIVKHIAIAHGGHVSVDSALGKGSTFSIYLPMKPR